MVKRFAAAWRFLTVLPFFRPPGDDEGDCLRRSVVMFPLVGAALGALAAVFTMVAGMLLPPLPTAAICTVLLAMFSLGFHLDGLADCADALLSPGRDRETALAVMKDSRVGAHGAMTLTLALLLKFSCLAALPPDIMPRAAFLMPLLGRTAMLFPMALLPYARPEGLGKVFAIENRGALLAWGGIAVAVALAGMLPPVAAVLGMLGWLLVNLRWVRLLRRRLGGATGDCYGAACEMGELVAGLAAAGWQIRVVMLL